MQQHCRTVPRCAPQKHARGVTWARAPRPPRGVRRAAQQRHAACPRAFPQHPTSKALALRSTRTSGVSHKRGARGGFAQARARGAPAKAAQHARVVRGLGRHAARQRRAARPLEARQRLHGKSSLHSPPQPHKSLLVGLWEVKMKWYSLKSPDSPCLRRGVTAGAAKTCWTFGYFPTHAALISGSHDSAKPRPLRVGIWVPKCAYCAHRTGCQRDSFLSWPTDSTRWRARARQLA